VNVSSWTRELLASVVVFLVALPLCMGIAIASGVPPAMGLVSGIIGGIVVGTLAGSPLQVSGPAAGLAVIVFEIVQEHGIAVVPVVVAVAGLLQLVAGQLRLGGVFRAVSPAVIHGMLAGIGVLIFASQFHVMVDDAPSSNGLTNLLTVPGAVYKGLVPMDDSPHHLAAAVGVITLVSLLAWDFVRKRAPAAIAVIPSPLVGIVIATTVAAMWSLPIAYVKVPANASELFSPPEMGTWAALLKPSLLAEALAMAAIASAESLLCAAAVDRLHSGERSDLDKELRAQGVGNITSGLLGGLPITGVIVRSTANVQAGATTRWSGVFHGVWLLAFVLLVPGVLEMIPRASLAAVLVVIGWRLVSVDHMLELHKHGRGELAIYGVTMAVIVLTNLLEGLLVGMALAMFRLAWTFSYLEVEQTEDADGVLHLHLKGAATFVGVPTLSRRLAEVPEDAAVHVHLGKLNFVDHACMELLSDWAERHRGGVVLAWSELEAISKSRPGEHAKHEAA
jgi:MFS superfamily sulfate permease-like transporter